MSLLVGDLLRLRSETNLCSFSGAGDRDRLRDFSSGDLLLPFLIGSGSLLD